MKHKKPQKLADPNSDEDLIAAFCNRHRDWRLSYKRDATIVFKGEHLFVIRLGVNGRGKRETLLADKIGSVYNENTPDLVKLAAEYHPAKSVRGVVLVHTTREPPSDETPIFEGRWCKTLRTKIIDWAAEKDANYSTDIQAEIAKYEAEQRADLARTEQARATMRRLAVAVSGLFAKLDYHDDDPFCQAWINFEGSGGISFWLANDGNDIRPGFAERDIPVDDFVKICEIISRGKSWDTSEEDE